MWPLQPRREQICTTPPPRTIIGTIGAPQSAQSAAPDELGVAVRAEEVDHRVDAGSRAPTRWCSCRRGDDSRSQPCLSPKEIVTRIDGWPSMRCAGSIRLWLQRGQLTSTGKTRWSVSIVDRVEPGPGLLEDACDLARSSTLEK